MNINDIITMNIEYILISFGVVNLIIFILSVTALCKASRMKKRTDAFLRPQSEQHNIEAMLIDYLEQVKQVNEKYERISNSIYDLDKRLIPCVQKVGLVRYNPFDDVGGDLSFAAAFLNQKNDGIVINSIYAREGCYSYAKPIVNGEADKYKLSNEEIAAVQRAMKN